MSWRPVRGTYYGDDIDTGIPAGRARLSRFIAEVLNSDESGSVSADHAANLRHDLEILREP